MFQQMISQVLSIPNEDEEEEEEEEEQSKKEESSINANGEESDIRLDNED